MRTRRGREEAAQAQAIERRASLANGQRHTDDVVDVAREIEVDPVLFDVDHAEFLLDGTGADRRVICVPCGGGAAAGSAGHAASGCINGHVRVGAVPAER
jgi:hypothetical protein